MLPLLMLQIMIDTVELVNSASFSTQTLGATPMTSTDQRKKCYGPM